MFTYIFAGLQRPPPCFNLTFSNLNPDNLPSTHQVASAERHSKVRKSQLEGDESTVQVKRLKQIPSNPASSTQSNVISNVLDLHRGRSRNTHKFPSVMQLSTHAQSFGPTGMHNTSIVTNHDTSSTSSSSTASAPASVQQYTTPGSSADSSKSSNYHLYRSRRYQKRRHNSIQPHGPSRLGFYSPRSKSILKEAKIKYRIYIATETAFPTTAQALENALKKYGESSDEYTTSTSADTETEGELRDVPDVDTGRLQVVSDSLQIYIALLSL
jgi:hypothetical protein